LTAPAGTLTPPVTLAAVAVTLPLPSTTMAFDELEFTTISPFAVRLALPLTTSELAAFVSTVCTRASSAFTVTDAPLVKPATLVAEHESVVPVV